MTASPEISEDDECRLLIGLFAAGHHADVEHRARALIDTFPGAGLVWKVLGASLTAQGKDGMAALQRATELLPGDPESHSNLGCALLELGRQPAAIARFQQALAIAPGFATAHHNLGIALKQLGQLDAALASFRRALQLTPDDAQVHADLGTVQSMLGQFNEAATSFRRALDIGPGLAELHYNLACACQELGQLVPAEAEFRRALALRSDFAEAHHCLGMLLNRLGLSDDAAACLRRALALKPDHAPSQLGLGHMLLRQGEFEEGWRLYQARCSPSPPTRSSPVPGLAYPEWQGEPLEGKSILIWPEQGMGDTLQFCRYAAELKRRGARHVTLVCKPALQDLLATLQGVDLVYPTDRPSPPPAHDFWTLLLNMPLHCATRLDTIPASTPYLHADPARMEQVSALWADAPGCRVGLCWKGNASYGHDAERSIGLAPLLPLLAVPDVRFVSLQPASRTDFMAAAGAAGLDLGHEIDAGGPPFQETAAMIMQLDLVITCDTSIGHLAGALGKPVWLLLAFAADWRWMAQRDDSPWYPHTRLFRQKRPGDWNEVIQRVHDQLSRVAGKKRSAPSPPMQTTFSAALAWHRQGKWPQARALYDQVLELDAGHADALHLLGVLLAQTGEPERASALIRKSLGIHPGNALAHNNLGNVLHDRKQHAAAIRCYEQAVTLQPGYADAWYNQGTALLALQQNEAALRSFDQALALRPACAEACNGRGTALSSLGQHEAAVQSHDQAIALLPAYADAWYNRGNALEAMGQHEPALHSYTQAMAHDPGHMNACINRGIVLQHLQRHDAALQLFDQAIAYNPRHAQAHGQRGSVLIDLGRHDAALHSLDHAIALDPGAADAHNNRGMALRCLRRHDLALQSFNSAIALQPGHAEAHGNRGNTLQDLGQHLAAMRSHERAVALKPGDDELQFNLSLSYLQLGDFDKGWEKYEHRLKAQRRGLGVRAFDQPQWTGSECLRGKTILLHSEQGLGDSLQFCRYAELVANLGARVILEVPESLSVLLAGLAGTSLVLAKGSELPPFDFQSPLLSLPKAFRTDLSKIPTPGRYIDSVPLRLDKWRARLGATKPLVGLAWSGHAHHGNDQNRSIPLAKFVTLLPDGYHYVCLQTDLREADRLTLQSRPDIQHFGASLEDFSDTAALCELMDVIVSVDTSLVHLAGAMGKPVWVLLPVNPDWRWMLHRSDSPWYSSARLYRQVRDGQDAAFASLKADLIQWIDCRKF